MSHAGHSTIEFTCHSLAWSVSFEGESLLSFKLLGDVLPGAMHPNAEQAIDQIDARPSWLSAFVRSLDSYLAGDMAPAKKIWPQIPIGFADSQDFAANVQRVARQIPFGETRSYGELAVMAGGTKGAARAVGSAMARNPCLLVIPCHRVLPSHGRSLGEFSAPGGAGTKRRFLDLEASSAGPLFLMNTKKDSIDVDLV